MGVPHESATYEQQGAYQRIFGNGSGLTATNNQLFGAVEEQAHSLHGSALAAGNFDASDVADEVAASAPYQVVLGEPTGMVDVRFTTATTQVWHQGADPDARSADVQHARRGLRLGRELRVLT